MKGHRTLRWLGPVLLACLAVVGCGRPTDHSANVANLSDSLTAIVEHVLSIPIVNGFNLGQHLLLG